MCVYVWRGVGSGGGYVCWCWWYGSVEVVGGVCDVCVGGGGVVLVVYVCVHHA